MRKCKTRWRIFEMRRFGIHLDISNFRCQRVAIIILRQPCKRLRGGAPPATIKGALQVTINCRNLQHTAFFARAIIDTHGNINPAIRIKLPSNVDVVSKSKLQYMDRSYILGCLGNVTKREELGIEFDNIIKPYFSSALFTYMEVGSDFLCLSWNRPGHIIFCRASNRGDLAKSFHVNKRILYQHSGQIELRFERRSGVKLENLGRHTSSYSNPVALYFRSETSKILGNISTSRTYWDASILCT